MGTPGVHETLQERAHARERENGHVRPIDQLEDGTAFAGGHPFGDDGPRAVRQRAEEDPFSTERRNAFAVYWKRLAILSVPRIVDSDRS